MTPPSTPTLTPKFTVFGSASSGLRVSRDGLLEHERGASAEIDVVDVDSTLQLESGGRDYGKLRCQIHGHFLTEPSPVDWLLCTGWRDGEEDLGFASEETADNYDGPEAVAPERRSHERDIFVGFFVDHLIRYAGPKVPLDARLYADSIGGPQGHGIQADLASVGTEWVACHEVVSAHGQARAEVWPVLQRPFPAVRGEPRLTGLPCRVHIREDPALTVGGHQPLSALAIVHAVGGDSKAQKPRLRVHDNERRAQVVGLPSVLAADHEPRAVAVVALGRRRLLDVGDLIQRRRLVRTLKSEQGAENKRETPPKDSHFSRGRSAPHEAQTRISLGNDDRLGLRPLRARHSQQLGGIRRPRSAPRDV
eukprot:scaffold2600_cov238-Pinguiococcus_pyrenoidosus.AAC.5